MKLKLVCVYDREARIYEAPMAVPHVVVAQRWFVQEVNNAESRFFHHAKAFELREVGEFDTSTGVCSALGEDMSEHVASGEHVQVKGNGNVQAS